jgi:GDP-4-dehydro-6-deoxy-D-mannose reductase
VARIEAGLAPPSLRVGNLDARRDISDVRDVVDAYVRLMASAPAGRPYNICSGRAWRIGDLLEELIARSTARVEIEIDPARLRPDDTPVIQGDASRLRAETGWRPGIPIEQTLADMLDWWRDEVVAER